VPKLRLAARPTRSLLCAGLAAQRGYGARPGTKGGALIVPRPSLGDTLHLSDGRSGSREMAAQVKTDGCMSLPAPPPPQPALTRWLSQWLIRPVLYCNAQKKVRKVHVYTAGQAPNEISGRQQAA
jgi:hypothetical protein